jgi:CheY-like chemotaxis protein
LFLLPVKKKILIADDDQSVRRMVARVLESSGYEVLFAGRSVEGQNAGPEPDLVLVDLKLADRGGWEVLERGREAFAGVPLIVMTAWPNQSDEAIRQGVDALMEKPLDLPLLLQTVADLLAESREDRRRGDPRRQALLSRFVHA